MSTTARSWLVARGLAQQSRGRFSREAIAALNEAVAHGAVFSDWGNKSEPKKSASKFKAQSNKTVARTPVRKEKFMEIVDGRGTLIRLDTHRGCADAIQFCNCVKLEPPKYINDIVSWRLV